MIKRKIMCVGMLGGKKERKKVKWEGQGSKDEKKRRERLDYFLTLWMLGEAVFIKFEKWL